jgi:hypothetical protein
MKYVDAQMERLVEYARKAFDDNLVLVVSGDHGQAFGDRHAGNLVHKNHLYEENVKNFLILVDFRRPPQSRGLSSSTVATLGDILPTVAGYVLGETLEVPGQNLFSESYLPRLAFFHKNALPQKWGMVDGQWKYIAELNNSGAAELYDLSQDPTEQKNLASQFPERLEVYRDLLQRWFVTTDREFLVKAIGHVQPGMESAATLEDVTRPGPKILTFGRVVNKEFQPLVEIHPSENLFAWSHGTAFGTETPVIYHWTSPSGRVRRVRHIVKAEWETVTVRMADTLPLEEGKWHLELTKDDGDVLVSGEFEVNSSAPEPPPATPPAAH